jgi:hypothetical protein
MLENEQTERPTSLGLPGGIAMITIDISNNCTV